jgi:hypothetical protein
MNETEVTAHRATIRSEHRLEFFNSHLECVVSLSLRWYLPRIKYYEQYELDLYRLICLPAPITTHPLARDRAVLFDSLLGFCNNDTRMCT